MAADGAAVERIARDLVVDDAALAVEFSAWIGASARFRRFVELHAGKIHKKLRGARDTDARRDVRTELRLAQRLLADPRIELAFEAYGVGKRGPDFTLTYRATQRFNLEVTRLRHLPSAETIGAALVAKLRQLPPSMPNGVVLAVDGSSADSVTVGAATHALRDRADRKDERFFTARGFAGTRGFYDRFLRLGAVFVWAEAAAGDAQAALWINRSARIAMPDRAATACLGCLRD
jgi:hypothetical protein